MAHKMVKNEKRILQKNDEHIIYIQSKRQKHRQSILPVITNPRRLHSKLCIWAHNVRFLISVIFI